MTATQETLLEELRGLLYSTPSDEGFALILKRIKRALRAKKTREQGQVMLSYAVGVMDEAWPDRHRVVSGKDAQMLMQGPQAWGELVRVLDLSWGNLGEEGFYGLTRAQHLEHLTGLLLFDQRIGAAGIEALTQGSALKSLRFLDLGQNDLDDGDIARLAGSKLFGSLEMLRLHINELSDASMEALAAAKGAVRLRHLDMSHTPLTSRALRVLNNASWFRRLQTLELEDCHNFEGTAVKALLKAPHDGGLVRLNLGSVKLTSSPWLETLAQSQHARSLRVLGLESCGLGWSVEHAQDLARFPLVRVLDLGHNDIEDHIDLSVLAGLPHLEYLNLQFNRVGDDVIGGLARARGWSSLRTLYLYTNEIGDEGARALLESELLSGLTHLNVGRNPIDKALQNELKQRMSGGKWSRGEANLDDRGWGKVYL